VQDLRRQTGQAYNATDNSAVRLVCGSFLAAGLGAAPLKLGLLLDMAGPYADVGGQGTVTAVRMAVDDFGGEVLGRR
jgi:branched-chain amino acid transport system substrate-binding protein